MSDMLIQEDPQIAAKRRLALAMMQQGIGTPIQSGNAMEPLARLAQTLIGAYMEKKAGEEDKSNRKASADALAEAVSGATSLKSEKGILYSPSDFQGSAFDQAAIAAAPEASGNQKRAALIDRLSKSPDENVRSIGGRMGLQLALADPVEQFITVTGEDAKKRGLDPTGVYSISTKTGKADQITAPDRTNTLLTPEKLKEQQDLRAAGRTSVSVSTAGPKAYEEERGKLDAKAESEIFTNERTARTSVAKYQQLGQMLGEIKTGAFKGTTTQLKAAAKSAGLDLDSWGITDDVAPAQAAQAFTNGLALELRNPAGGAGMPGAMSDADREYLKQMVAGIEKDPEANVKMIDAAIRMNQRSLDVARLAREYKKKNGGRFDEAGFTDFLDQWSAQNPLFPEATKSAPGSQPGPAAPDANAPVDYKSMYGLS